MEAAGAEVPAKGPVAGSVAVGSSASNLSTVLKEAHAKQRQLHDRIPTVSAAGGGQRALGSGRLSSRGDRGETGIGKGVLSQRPGPATKRWQEDSKGRDDYKNLLQMHLKGFEPKANAPDDNIIYNQELASNYNGDENFNAAASVSEGSHSREFSFDPQKQMNLG